MLSTNQFFDSQIYKHNVSRNVSMFSGILKYSGRIKMNMYGVLRVENSEVVDSGGFDVQNNKVWTFLDQSGAESF